MSKETRKRHRLGEWRAELDRIRHGHKSMFTEAECLRCIESLERELSPTEGETP
ncbi:MAG TPA: hypothetical protein PK308_00025 [Phycisphaerales bacterium]|nr:hypothetical protein [Phycisphaerales bacterium]